jgi:choline dehydrogenase-like flavoprotein
MESGEPGAGRYPAVHLDAEDPYPHGDVNTSHSGGIGGTAGQWSFELATGDDTDADTGNPPAAVGCRYTPLQPLDLVARPEIGTPGWPISAAELDHWYERAQALCGLGPYRYDVEAWADQHAQPLPLDGTGVVTSMFQFGPASVFTEQARNELTAHGITFLTGTDALWLTLQSSTNRVSGVLVHGPDGQAEVRARTVVLAAGGMESTRILLDTGRHEGRTPGNHAGLLGRFFMEHPLVRGGLLVTEPADRWLSRLGLYGTRRVDGTYVSARLTLADEVVRDHGLLACSLLLVPRDRSYARPGPLALSRLRSPSGRRDNRRTKITTATRVALGAPDIVRAVLARRDQPSIDHATWAHAGTAQDVEDPRRRWSPERFSVFEVLHQTEQSPDPDNRLRLADSTDALGRSELTLTWRWTRDDRRRIARSRDLFATALAERGVGRLLNTDYDRGDPRLLGGTHHHMGTTRMSVDPAEGVVDPNTRVHGWDNLYVAAASVFPSSGFVNPTLTVAALGLRLGAHLTTRRARSASA